MVKRLEGIGTVAGQKEKRSRLLTPDKHWKHFIRRRFLPSGEMVK
ncbi:hypothetical protein [Cytobacillus sp. IB215665]|nr:hypothetical protein [Cytobacillus sp. IB215665]